ncbi:hypothetical protein ASPZODRAFT_169945 [Penicilliopsis zonata CBS 506.65]|uniref:Uncharacterized protein n=1 Tax=Penicilliopsis zonata CBS 506.65 TaxID=1073090 RepID=A0A1L9S692_9EURO|nr:hypothetical protein ASPZODRAFT_169945 [Penicilliopsis zonata CBS 506.65]OJJ42655.1 hypothetical protein ASPZODRAFT_169945 [Penicilliopsis zonata CBS 506.65]
MSTQLPPDQSLSVETLGGRLVLHSVSEDGITIGKDTPYESLTGYHKGSHFFSESIQLTSAVQAPYGLTLSAWTVICGQARLTLDATGVDGGASAPNGQPGGALTLYVQDTSDATAQNLSLLARGGKGYDLRPATSGRPGNGGRGGTIVSVVQPTYIQAWAPLDGYYARAEFHPTDEQDYHHPVKPGDSVFVAGRGIVQAGQRLAAPAVTITDIFQPLADELADGHSPSVLSIKLAVVKVRRALSSRIAQQQVQLAPTAGDVRGGYGGVGVGVLPPVTPGGDGVPGTEMQVFLKDWAPAQLATARAPFVHPKQCSMLANRANLFFYMNSPKLRSHARTLYHRILSRLSFLPLQASDPLWKAYQDCPFMPTTSLQDLENIKTDVTLQLTHLDSGKVNFHGFAPTWVPRASYKFYKEVFDDAMGNLQALETAYINYHAALAKQQDLNEDLKAVYKNTTQMVEGLQKDIEDLQLMAQTLDGQITDLRVDVALARQSLLTAMNAELQAIKAAFGFTVLQLINVFTMVNMVPGSSKILMGLLEGGEVVYQGFTEIPTTDGTSIRKEYLASQFHRDVKTLEKLSVLLAKRKNGDYELDEAFGVRVLADKDELNAQLDRFSTEAFGGVHDAATRKAMNKAFDALLAVLDKRNMLIFKYNAALKLIVAKTAQQAAFQKQERDLSRRRIESNDPDLPIITTYVDAIYQAARARVMKLLDLLLRSLNFRMLIASDIYDYAFEGSDPNHPGTLDKVPLALTTSLLHNMRSKVQARFSQSVEYWGSEPAKFPGNFDHDVGKKYALNKFQLKALLGGAHEIVLTIPTARKLTPKAGDFAGCCNVRLYRVRFQMKGLKLNTSKRQPAEEALVKFTLTHGGHETLVDRANLGMDFDHDPVRVLYSFRLHADGTQTVLDNGNVAESDINQVATSYAAPGPFAEWTISMAGSDFDNLDLTHVTGAYFDFCGTNYAFK